ncbi:MAG: phosphoribosylamine--glycine ligase [archaeon GB-1867-005]|nr:phosphoribosylamine--glycine ligase [Candidatus Culexmicrobium cathedralense]
MKVMGVGGGAREHALAEAIARSSHEVRIYWVSELRNPGIYRLVKRSGGEYALARTIDAEKVAELADNWSVDVVVVGPEEPNFHGVPDEVERRGIPCIGAKRSVSIIEMSKAEMRRLQWKYDVPGKLLFRTYKSYAEALEDLQRFSETLTWLQNVALKPARQAGGKGVKVVEDLQAYLHKEKMEFKERHIKWLEEYMRKYGDVDERILVEEKVWGPEYTLQCFVDGYTVVGMPLVQDNKHAYDFDIGPETGGMGSYTGRGRLLPFITLEEYERSLEIVKAMVRAVQDVTGEKYRGFIAGQMMLTEVEGPTLIEMYSRLGDPEAVNVLALLKTDIIDIFEAIIDGRLSKLKIEFSDEATVVKAIAPKGYPDFRSLAKGHEVSVDERLIKEAGCKLYWGSVHLQDDGRMITGGSRMLEILALAEDPPKASRRIDECLSLNPVKLLDGWGIFYRSDIGSAEMIQRRMAVAERVRRLYKYREERGILGKRIDWLPKIGRINPVELLIREIKAGG